jgi:hypothetical protein
MDEGAGKSPEGALLLQKGNPGFGCKEPVSKKHSSPQSAFFSKMQEASPSSASFIKLDAPLGCYCKYVH